MTGLHKVKQGEHLSGIALQYGFTDYRRIWDSPENAELKSRRENPNVLFPGDLLFIPDKESKEEIRPVDEQHKFRLLGKPLKLRLKLEKGYNQPIANTPCELQVEFEKFDLTSDGNGLVEQRIPANAVNARLVIKDVVKSQSQEVPLDIEVPVSIGHLDPVEEISGQQARLSNLGYYRGAQEPLDADEFASAMEEFQCEHDLAVDGICGPLTQARLRKVHGC